MRITFVVTCALVIGYVGTTSAQDVYHNGYMRQNGTYVAPHYQSAPDHSYNNNWSTSPNVNPYTGQTGTRMPTYNDRPPGSSGFSPSPTFNGSPAGYGNQFNRW